MPTAFVTGCATGFGHLLCKRLLALGWHVVATDPVIDDLERALAPDAATRQRLLVLKMDLSHAPSIRGAVSDALDWSPVDVLVNNGGYAVFGTQEDADLIAIEKMFSVNVFGALHATKALLPTLRERQGTVVNVSSVAGRMSFPESGFYAASKHALEAISEALFEETCTFGVKVRVVEPGSFDTNFAWRAREMSEPRRDDSAYADLFARWDKRKLASLEAPQNPALVVDAIIESLSDPRPFFRVQVGPDSQRIVGLRDAIDHDAWVVLMARRNGMFHGMSGPADVMTPPEVLSYGVDGPDDVFAATTAAWHYGHLGHWDETDEGREALHILVRRQTPKAAANDAPAMVSPDVLALAMQLSDTKRLVEAANAAAEAVSKLTGHTVPGLAIEAAETLKAAKATRKKAAPRPKTPKSASNP